MCVCTFNGAGLIHEDLKVFLLNNVPQGKKKKKSSYILGVADPKLGSAIQETLEIPCMSGINFDYLVSPNIWLRYFFIMALIEKTHQVHGCK